MIDNVIAVIAPAARTVAAGETAETAQCEETEEERDDDNDENTQDTPLTAALVCVVGRERAVLEGPEALAVRVTGAIRVAVAVRDDERVLEELGRYSSDEQEKNKHPLV